jgi:hypothetical protein
LLVARSFVISDAQTLADDEASLARAQIADNNIGGAAEWRNRCAQSVQNLFRPIDEKLNQLLLLVQRKKAFFDQCHRRGLGISLFLEHARRSFLR